MTGPRPRFVTSRLLTRGLRDLVFPPHCLHCDELCEDSTLRHVCRRCASLIMKVRRPHCPTCGHPFFGEAEGERICPHCEGLTPAYASAKTVTLFKGPVRQLVLALKYRHGLHVLEDMETLIRANEEVVQFLKGAVLVPIPLHPRKERERGFNQSKLIAECFLRAAKSRGEIAELLRRVRDTSSQTEFDRRSRRARMKNAFAARRGATITPDQRYVLVDDVFTTGSTLSAAATALQKAGAVKIDVVTFAHG